MTGDSIGDKFNELEEKRYGGNLSPELESAGVIATTILYLPKFAYMTLKALSIAKKERAK